MNPNQNQIDDLDYSEEISDEEFVESYTSKKRRREKSNIEDLNYLEEEVKKLWVYPLTTLTGKNSVEGIRVSNEKTTIMCTTLDKGKEITAYLEDTDTYDLNEFMDPSNPTEQLIKNSKIWNIITSDFEDLDFNLIYLLSFEKLTADNFDKTKHYFAKTIQPNVEDEWVELNFVSIDEFSSLFKAKPVKVVLSEPITEEIAEINVKSPIGTLIGNIGVIDENGNQPSLLAKEGTQIFPKLVFPFQVQPKLSTVEYWASKQIIPFQEFFDFLDSKDIAYDEEFSLADFLKLGDDADYPKTHFPEAREIEYLESGKEDTGKWILSGGIPSYKWEAGTPEPYQQIRIINEGTRLFSKGVPSPDRIQLQPIFKTIESIKDLDVTPIGVGKNTDAFTAIMLMLTETFWKDMEFEGATKVDIKDGQKIETIDDENIFKLSQKYVSQDRYAVTTNVWIAWKRKNPDLVNANPEMIKRIENALAMLSGYIKSNYSINKGDNDDYKVLLPFYFELQNKLDNPSHWVTYKDIIVKLKSNYGEFTKDGFVFTNKNVSYSKIFELEYNHFAFPELTKNVETASIPSSMPLDQELANGEYSKYLMLNFAKDENQQKLYLNRYGSGNMRFDPISSALNNEGEFEVEKPLKISEIQITSFYGFGNWEFELITKEKQKYKINLELFSKYDNTKTLVDLIL